MNTVQISGDITSDKEYYFRFSRNDAIIGAVWKIPDIPMIAVQILKNGAEVDCYRVKTLERAHADILRGLSRREVKMKNAAARAR